MLSLITAFLFISSVTCNHPPRPNGLPRISSIRHGLTERNSPPHSAQWSRAESCEMRGSQLIGVNLVMRHGGNGARCVKP
jgi:hypothetical protein